MPSRRSGATVASLRGLGGHRAPAAAADPDRSAARPAGQRPGALRRPADDASSWPASPTALVEETPTLPAHGRRDAGRPDNPARQPRPDRRARRRRAGELAGIERLAYDGTALPVDAPTSWRPPRSPPATSTGATSPHFLLKEISEAPASFRKTLRGKLVERRRTARRCELADETLPADAARPTCAPGAIRRVLVIGQGTAAVAGQSLARRARAAPSAARRSRCDAVPATELSGFGLRADMTDTLVVAISQSGTTTDTNRTVDLVARPRRRGRRHRQPARQRPHRQGRRRALHLRRPRRGDERRVDQGVLRPDRGRLPAGAAPSPTEARRRRRPTDRAARGARRAARAARRDDSTVLAAPARDRRGRAAARAAAAATGPSSATASTASPPHELRIKLSELCYKSIACDATEDKKHIDLSAEPLILVCAAGLHRLDRRRRGQGGRDLPGPQGGADRDRQRGRGRASRPRCR